MQPSASGKTVGPFEPSWRRSLVGSGHGGIPNAHGFQREVGTSTRYTNPMETMGARETKSEAAAKKEALVREMLERVADKWTLLVVEELGDGRAAALHPAARPHRRREPEDADEDAAPARARRAGDPGGVPGRASAGRVHAHAARRGARRGRLRDLDLGREAHEGPSSGHASATTRRRTVAGSTTPADPAGPLGRRGARGGCLRATLAGGRPEVRLNLAAHEKETEKGAAVSNECRSPGLKPDNRPVPRRFCRLRSPSSPAPGGSGHQERAPGQIRSRAPAPEGCPKAATPSAPSPREHAAVEWVLPARENAPRRRTRPRSRVQQGEPMDAGPAPPGLDGRARRFRPRFVRRGSRTRPRASRRWPRRRSAGAKARAPAG